LVCCIGSGFDRADELLNKVPFTMGKVAFDLQVAVKQVTRSFVLFGLLVQTNKI